MKKYRHFFFDLDNTLTPSRSAIRPHMADFLSKIEQTIIVVSGSLNEQMRSQIANIYCYQLGQNGNHALSPEGIELWSHKLDSKEKKEIYAHIALIKDNLPHDVPDQADLIEDRGSQISFSIYGHHAPTEEKRAYDGDFQKRKRLLKKIPFHSRTAEVQMGGSTCLDYFKRGYNKGSNIQKLIAMQKWNKDECIYFGDALFEGGNDSSVVGVIETITVTDEEDTYCKLKELQQT